MWRIGRHRTPSVDSLCRTLPPASVTTLSLRPFLLVCSLALGLAPWTLVAQQKRPAKPPVTTPPTAPPNDTLTAAERAALRTTSRDARAMARRRLSGDSSVRRAKADSAAATAFGSEEARNILAKARQARTQQDSALTAYRATTTQRISVGMGVRRVGLEKLLFRADNVAQVAWKRGVGVWVTPVGSRMTVPMASRVDGDIVDAVSIPYFPGRESLWFPSSNFGVVKTDIDEREVIHPLAIGAETYYHYDTGDSLDITLEGGRVIRVRELRIRARTPQWRLFVGSFWFDRDGGQLVRAAYRLAVDIDIWDVANDEGALDAAENKVAARMRDSLVRANLPRELYMKDSTQRAARAARQGSGSNNDDVPAWVSSTFRPAKAKLDAITVEYGLYQGKFWLPRANSATASAQMGFMRVPVQIDEKFTYEAVNGDFSLPALPAARVQTVGGAVVGDSSGPGDVTISMGVGGKPDTSRSARRDSILNARSGGAKARQCATDSTWTRVETRFEGALRVGYAMPCDMNKLALSKALPPAFASDEELFDMKSRDELLASLDLSLQPGFAPRPIRINAGIAQARFNRVEGLSLGVVASTVLGAGYTVSALGRIGYADWHANGEFSLARSNGKRTVTATAYHRLAATNPEWGGALTLGPSLPALLYGRDEGFYYRAFGAELGERREMRRGSLDYRLFVERQWSAGDSSVVNTFSLAKAFTGARFARNIIGEPVSLTGVSGSLLHAYGNNPNGFRLTTTTRLEAATGTFSFARASLEATTTRSIGRYAAALTGAAGSSLGRLPAQRAWYMGGLRSVRGQPPGTQSGNAFWMARAEVGTRASAFRPVGFFDVGWAGSRDAFSKTQPQRGVGVGLGFLDGLFRMDLARGLYPNKRWRFDLYLEAPL